MRGDVREGSIQATVKRHVRSCNRVAEEARSGTATATPRHHSHRGDPDGPKGRRTFSVLPFTHVGRILNSGLGNLRGRRGGVDEANVVVHRRFSQGDVLRHDKAASP